MSKKDLIDEIRFSIDECYKILNQSESLEEISSLRIALSNYYLALSNLVK